MNHRRPTVGEIATVTGLVVHLDDDPIRAYVTIELPRPHENRPDQTPTANRPDVTLDEAGS